MNNNNEANVGKSAAQWAEQACLPCWYSEETTSTNDIAKADSGIESLKLFFTDYQTKGRGRGSHTWVTADRGDSLLSSWAFLTSKAPQPVLSAAIGLAVFRALKASWPSLNFSTKAPNDIYLDGKKIAGILLESVSQGEKYLAIVGLGINFFSAPNIENSTHLSQKISELSIFDLCQFLDRLLLELTMAISSTSSKLSFSQRQSLLFALNENTSLAEKYSEILEDGSLKSSTKTIHWSDL